MTEALTGCRQTDGMRGEGKTRRSFLFGTVKTEKLFDLSHSQTITKTMPENILNLRMICGKIVLGCESELHSRNGIIVYAVQEMSF